MIHRSRLLIIGGLISITLSLTILVGINITSAASNSPANYPLQPSSPCGSSGKTCQQIVDEWNQASWNDLVDETFDSSTLPVATVRWYVGEDEYTLRSDSDCPDVDQDEHQFCGVTDEFSNVLLSHALGSVNQQANYEKLHNFSELLRNPASNQLQCWKYHVDGIANYADSPDGVPPHEKLCVLDDSASDASIRILGAYGIACAKQQAGFWQQNSVDYCVDYLQQGNAIFGIGTMSHGEIKVLPNGEYFLANGYDNQVGAPTATQSFRPDYYELQFLMDFAKYMNNPELVQGVVDMLEDYQLSMGANHIHRDKTGHFDDLTQTYFADDVLLPDPYMDQIDTWRAIPALSGLLLVHPESVPNAVKTEVFDYWWSNFAGGHGTLFGPTQTKPIEIYSDKTDPTIRAFDSGYKTMGMWMPLGAVYDDAYTIEAVNWLIDYKYSANDGFFYGAVYYGGYFSQFAQRAIGAVTGMIDPAYWNPPDDNPIVRNGDFSAGFDEWFHPNPGASVTGTVSVMNGELCSTITILAADSQPWDFVVGQNNLPLQAEQEYSVRFDARANPVREMSFRLVNSTTFSESLNEDVMLSTQMGTFSFLRPATQTNSNSILEFRMGDGEIGDWEICIDNVAIDTTTPTFVTTNKLDIAVTDSFSRHWQLATLLVVGTVLLLIQKRGDRRVRK